MDDEAAAAENKQEPRQYTPLQPFPHHFRNKKMEQSLEPEPTLRHNYYHSRRKVLLGIMANLKWFFLLIVSGFIGNGVPRFLMKGWSVTSLEIEGPNQEQYRAIFPRYDNDGKLLDPYATIKLEYAPPPPLPLAPRPPPPRPGRPPSTHTTQPFFPLSYINNLITHAHSSLYPSYAHSLN